MRWQHQLDGTCYIKKIQEHLHAFFLDNRTEFHEMDILAEFPHLVQVDTQGLHYEGYLKLHGESYQIKVKTPSKSRLCDTAIYCEWKLQQLLQPYQSIIKQRLSQCENLLTFLKELQSISERQLDQNGSRTVGTSKFCSQLIAEIEQLGWEKLCFIDTSFTELHLKYTDDHNRDHVIKLHISAQYPKESPRCSVELPAKFDIHWSPESDILHIYNQFKDVAQQYQEFWDMMEEIDRSTWILEPEKPTHSATYRRVAISPSVSVQITVDPTQPRLLPECKFLGSDQAIAPIRQSMNTNIHTWDEGCSLLQNLSRLLDVEFPSPVNSKKEEFNLECGICYSYRLETEIPDEVCNDSRCGQAYHKICLIEWLRALPSSRQSFNTIFGNCPYCEKAITVKILAK